MHSREVDIAGLTCDPGPLLFCETLVSSLSDALRKQGISYVTRRGQGVLVAYKKHVTLPKGLVSKPITSKNLFAPKRAQIIGVMLAFPEVVARSMRELAHASGTTPGYVHGTFSMLEQQGFLRRWNGGAKLVGVQGLGVDNVLFRGYCDESTFAIPEHVYALIGGEWVIPEKLIPGNTLTLYIEEPDLAVIQQTNRFAKRRTAEFSTQIEIRRKYWQVDTDQYNWSTEKVPRLFIAADLMCGTDGRLQEVAKELVKELGDGISDR